MVPIGYAVERRDLKLSNGRVIYTRLPTLMERQEADWEFSRIFNKAIQNGIPPRQVFVRTLMEQGLWTQEDEIQMSTLRVALDTKQLDLEDTKDKDKVQKEIEVLQQNLVNLQQKLNSFSSHTAEYRADEARRNYTVSIVTENEDGSRVWKTYADLCKDTDEELVNSAIIQYIFLENGINPEKAKEIKTSVEAKIETKTEPIISSTECTASADVNK